MQKAAERFGYDESQVELRLYVGKFYGTDGKHEALIREWCAGEIVGGGPIGVWNLHEIVVIVRELAKETQYRDNPALVAVKVLLAADGALQA